MAHCVTMSLLSVAGDFSAACSFGCQRYLAYLVMLHLCGFHRAIRQAESTELIERSS